MNLVDKQHLQQRKHREQLRNTVEPNNDDNTNTTTTTTTNNNNDNDNDNDNAPGILDVILQMFY